MIAIPTGSPTSTSTYGPSARARGAGELRGEVDQPERHAEPHERRSRRPSGGRAGARRATRMSAASSSMFPHRAATIAGCTVRSLHRGTWPRTWPACGRAGQGRPRCCPTAARTSCGPARACIVAGPATLPAPRRSPRHPGVRRALPARRGGCRARAAAGELPDLTRAARRRAGSRGSRSAWPRRPARTGAEARRRLRAADAWTPWPARPRSGSRGRARAWRRWATGWGSASASCGAASPTPSATARRRSRACCASSASWCWRKPTATSPGWRSTPATPTRRT